MNYQRIPKSSGRQRYEPAHQSMAANCPTPASCWAATPWCCGHRWVVAVPAPIFGYNNPLPLGMDSHIAAVALFGNGTRKVPARCRPSARSTATRRSTCAPPTTPSATTTSTPNTWVDNWPARQYAAYVDAGLVDRPLRSSPPGCSRVDDAAEARAAEERQSHPVESTTPPRHGRPRSETITPSSRRRRRGTRRPRSETITPSSRRRRRGTRRPRSGLAEAPQIARDGHPRPEFIVRWMVHTDQRQAAGRRSGEIAGALSGQQRCAPIGFVSAGPTARDRTDQ